MRKVLTVVCLMAVAHHVAAECNLPTYTETFVPECAPQDTYIRWPNYENPKSYYRCQGVGNPVLANCPSSQYFCFVLQQCVDCSQVIPAVPCQFLKTQNPPNCVPINGSSSSPPTGLPTPHYPSSTTTEKTTKTTTPKTEKTTKSTAPTPTTAKPTPSIPTPPTDGIPPPPSPVTNDPNIPMPPTPPPTPPSIVVTPPNIPSLPVTG